VANEKIQLALPPQTPKNNGFRQRGVPGGQIRGIAAQ
jgi:hypothetical protein